MEGITGRDRSILFAHVCLPRNAENPGVVLELVSAVIRTQFHWARRNVLQSFF